MPDYGPDNHVNCTFAKSIGHAKVVSCSNPEAAKHFKWPEGKNTPSKGTCKGCSLRVAADPNQPVIIGIIAKAKPPAQAPRPRGPDLPKKSWWAKKSEDPNGKNFGSELWRDLHQWAATGDVSDADRWLQSFALRLPCGECRVHFQQMIQKNPPPKTSNQNLAFWTFERHNEVNRSKEKPSPEITWDETVDIQGWPVEWKTVNE